MPSSCRLSSIKATAAIVNCILWVLLSCFLCNLPLIMNFFYLLRSLALWLWIAIVIVVYNIARVDILVFGAGFYNRGKCNFGGHDCIIDENVFVCFFLIPKINILCSNLICFHQQSNLNMIQLLKNFQVSLMPRTFKECNIPCTICGCKFTNRAGLANHLHVHRKPSLKKAHSNQLAAWTATPSHSPSVDSFGQPDDAGMLGLPEDGSVHLPQHYIHEIFTYYPFINGSTLDLLSILLVLIFFKDCPVISMENLCLKDYPHCPEITHHPLISCPPKTALHLNWQTSFFGENKCLLVTSAIYSKSGPQCFPATKIHPSTANKLCMTLLMW